MNRYKELLEQVKNVNHTNINKSVLYDEITSEEYALLLKMYLDKKFEKDELGDKTIKEWMKVGVNKTIDGVQDAYSEQNIAKRVEESHKR